ncbi:tetratricopeptide repeat protein [Vibrio fluvialis]|uniref:tetratricopeptide repeat protein n=1 Tax=Vibrio fluvialis TaxID=676 RepID=UPI0023A96D85|nr:tetratricopeptide repeat protein [Vibrio fluvialis]MDE5179117.1 tetratricopeptide repeat protein [Vibrio fluvialis]
MAKDSSLPIYELFNRNFEAAYPKLRNLADLGNADACYYLGKMYLRGDYVQQSDNYAFYLIKQSALQGCRDAQALISELYLQGEGCEQSRRKAILFLTKAAKQGCPDASVRLAEHYINGVVVKQNYNIALYWLRSNKPMKSLFTRKVILKEFVEQSEERREHKRLAMAINLYFSFIYWRVLKPIFTK